MNFNVLDIKISTLDKEETNNFIFSWLSNNEKGYICTVNPEFLLLSQKDKEFKNILNNSKINTPDGIGLLWAAWFLKSQESRAKSQVFKYFYGFISLIIFLFYKKPFRKIIKERIAGTEIIYDITKIAYEQHKKIFLLGGNSVEDLEIVRRKLFSIIDKLFMFPSPESFIDFDLGFVPGDSILDENINAKLIEKINNSGAEIIFVCLSFPRQEKWVYNNLNKLKSIKLGIGLGGTFDVISGYKKSVPKFFKTLGLEWLFRLIIEPKRFKRIFNAVIKFPIEIIKNK